ncbi:MAG: hypothetical protein JNL05_03505 [Flavobacteriales bacterium]|nr:hypothetical protein [Flavobacteriales bacterium]
MSWSVAIAVAVVNGLICGALVVPLSFALMRAHKVHDRDGGMSMGIIFQVAPVTFVLAALLGLWGTHLAGASGWDRFWAAVGWSAGIGLGVMGLFAAFSLLGIQRPPRIDGAALELQVEVTVPASSLPEGTLDLDQLKLSLYAGPRDNHYGDIDRQGIRRVGADWVVHGRAAINSIAPQRMLSLQAAPDTSFVLDMPLAPLPTKADLAWAGPFTTREGRLRDGQLLPTAVTMRYRVVRSAEAGK